ncbi:MAG TPA: thiol:disulfide interchange protein [Petrimonas sp.]|uniref:protein-disulfide reductase DsbD family protein n=1 Tax=Petrimonas sp. TaxID=2023866 RepID=UPI0017799EB1|nr:thiol:disulfide interchange protein [Petrimonas sp.]
MDLKRIITSLVLLFTLFQAFPQNVINWKFSLQDKGNGEVELVADATIQQGWHMYDSKIPDNGPYPTSLSFDELKGAEVLGDFHATGKQATVKYDPVFQMNIGTFDNSAKFIQRLKVTDKDNFSVAGDVRAQACDDQSCTPPLPNEFSFNSTNLPKIITVAASTREAVSSTPEAAMVPVENLSLDSVSSPAPVAADKELLWTPVTEELNSFGSQHDDSSSLWSIFLKGLIWGFAALLTPCVWPMIPITVSFFLNRNKKVRRKAVSDAAIYGSSIIFIYVALGLVITAIFGASALNNIATSAVFNLIFFALLLIFAMSFLGAFELVLPASWTNKMDSKVDSTSGLISLFFMAFTLALVSFSCTGPIIGWLLVEAATQGSYLAPAIGMLGFAIALAIPFTLFAIFPSWLKTLPKSGSWLNSVKVVLGFIVLAVSMKFLSVADLSNGWGILNRDVFLVLWIVISGILGFYLLGKLKFHGDSDVPHVTIPRLFLSIFSFAFALYLIPGLWGAPLKPISSILPPLSTQDFKLNEVSLKTVYTDYETGMAAAAQTGKPALVSFAGHGCVNCHKMDATVLVDERVKNLIDNEFVYITLMVDERAKLPEILEVDENGRKTKLKTVGDKWSYLQREKFGAQSQPYYVILDHSGKPVAPAHAFDENISNYVKFLETGLRNFKK